MKAVLFATALFVLGLITTGCQQLATGIGASYAIIETTAEAVQAECGNLEAGGDCVEDSLLNRRDVDRVKRDLQDAKDMVDLANDAYNRDQRQEAADLLGRADGILNSIKGFLQARGVE